MDQPTFPAITTPLELARPALAAARTTRRQPQRSHTSLNEQTPLALFVRARLSELGLKQADFCRLNMFDQGMLSRIQNSAAVNLNLESVLRLAVGLRVSPLTILELIERPDLHELILLAYANSVPELARLRLRPGI